MPDDTTQNRAEREPEDLKTTHNITLRVPEDLKKLLEELAVKEERSTSAQCIWMLRRAVSRANTLGVEHSDTRD